MLLAPEDFARAWGSDALVRPAASSVPESIPSEARAFLVRAGLPALIRYFGGSSECRITFCRLASGLSPVLAAETVGPPLPPEWSLYRVLGDEFFCNGAAWWCLHEQTGQVDRIDIELAQPIEFVNSSVAHFAAAVLAASAWSSRGSRSAEAWPTEVDAFKRELAVIDPECMASRRSFWPVYLDFIREEGPRRGAFEKGSRLQGERASRAGPW
jgi:hypothetical protein